MMRQININDIVVHSIIVNPHVIVAIVPAIFPNDL